jgi:heme/copper-type cytochrome/quinol oxidase subunit 2
MNKINPYKLKGIIAFFILQVFFTIAAIAQSPTHLPREQHQPVDFFETTGNIVFFIVIPIVVVILYLVWRRRQKKQHENRDKI